MQSSRVLRGNLDEEGRLCLPSFQIQQPQEDVPVGLVRNPHASHCEDGVLRELVVTLHQHAHEDELVLGVRIPLQRLLPEWVDRRWLFSAMDDLHVVLLVR